MDSYEHIIKTTNQWDDRSIGFKILPRGCLCVELCKNDVTKIKIGTGHHYYSQLPYVTSIDDMTDYYTKEEIDTLLSNLKFISIKSTYEYPSTSNLPMIGNMLGDVRLVHNPQSTPTNPEDPLLYMWNDTLEKWIFVGGPFTPDMSDYVTKQEIMPTIDELVIKSHTHQNKSTLDEITQSDIDKLKTLHNYDDTEIRYQLSDQQQEINELNRDKHTHSNKSVIDQITQSMVDSIGSYEECCTTVKRQIQQLQSVAHTHSNKHILDSTTAVYTAQNAQTLYDLSQISTFIGATETNDGIFGYVPKPLSGDNTKYLRGDATWGDPVEDFRQSVNSNINVLVLNCVEDADAHEPPLILYCTEDINV